MIDTLRNTMDRRPLVVAFLLLITSVAGAADRVVLGEYFTNQF